MDWERWSHLIFFGTTLLIVFVGFVAVYFVQSFRIDRQLVQVEVLCKESLEEGYLKSVDVAERHPKWVEPQIFACQLAVNTGRYAVAEDHGRKAIQLLQGEVVRVTLCFDAGRKEDKVLSNVKYEKFLLIMVEDLIARAAVLACYTNYDYEGALQRCDDFNSESKSYKTLVDAWRPHFCMLLGRYDEAEQHLENARRKDIKCVQYLAIQGHWHLIHGDPKSAVEYYLKHGDRKSLAEDFVHIKAVFGIDEPRW